MRALLRLAGALLILGSLLGLAGVALAPILPESVFSDSDSDSSSSFSFDSSSKSGAEQLGVVVARVAGDALRAQQQRPIAAASVPPPPGFRPITRLALPRISLVADVVPATLIDAEGGETWQVPAFKVGHAETTAGAGQPGNAVLLGHVTSLRSGNVFERLDQTLTGDLVRVFSDDDEFDYQVVAVQHVPRTDSDVLAPGTGSAVSMITCTGLWLPTVWDYSERLVVRAELVAHG